MLPTNVEDNATKHSQSMQWLVLHLVHAGHSLHVVNACIMITRT